jgi:hypothetical protein
MTRNLQLRNRLITLLKKYIKECRIEEKRKEAIDRYYNSNHLTHRKFRDNIKELGIYTLEELQKCIFVAKFIKIKEKNNSNFHAEIMSKNMKKYNINENHIKNIKEIEKSTNYCYCETYITNLYIIYHPELKLFLSLGGDCIQNFIPELKIEIDAEIEEYNKCNKCNKPRKVGNLCKVCYNKQMCKVCKTNIKTNGIYCKECYIDTICIKCKITPKKQNLYCNLCFHKTRCIECRKNEILENNKCYSCIYKYKYECFWCYNKLKNENDNCVKCNG